MNNIGSKILDYLGIKINNGRIIPYYTKDNKKHVIIINNTQRSEILLNNIINTRLFKNFEDKNLQKIYLNYNRKNKLKIIMYEI